MTTASPRTFTATVAVSRASLATHPGELATVVNAEKARLTDEMTKAGYRRSGTWRTSVMWARADESTTPHSWIRSTQAKASARVVHLSVMAVRK